MTIIDWLILFILQKKKNYNGNTCNIITFFWRIIQSISCAFSISFYPPSSISLPPGLFFHSRRTSQMIREHIMINSPLMTIKNGALNRKLHLKMTMMMTVNDKSLTITGTLLAFYFCSFNYFLFTDPILQSSSFYSSVFLLYLPPLEFVLENLYPD